MKAKTVLTVSLLAFVAAALVTVAIQSSGGGGTPTPPASAQAAKPSDAPELPADAVVAFYFHGDVRCPTCMKLEEYSREAVESSFGENQVAFRVVNVDRSVNKHFVADFQLTTKALVLAEYRDGTVARWKDLKEIWERVGNRDDYLAYVRREVTAFVTGS